MKKKCLLFFFSSFSSSSKLQIDQAIYVSAARFQDLIIAQSLARSAREHLRGFDNNRDTLARLFSSRRRRRRRGERERGKNLCARLLNTNNPVGLVCPSCRTRLLFTARRHQPCALEQNSRETVAVADVIVETRIR
jgi:predicted amidophosphoribosyltransferase